MRLISRHILTTLAAPFIWGVVALTGLMLMQSLPPLIDRFGGRGLPAIVMFKAVLLFLPLLLTKTMPMAVLISALYGYSHLASALEMVAMYSNGISVWRMARPALIAALLVSLCNFFLLDQLAPQTAVRFNNLQRAAMNTSPTLALRQHVLNQMPPPASYIIKAERINPETSVMTDVTIYDLSQNDVRREIISDSGKMEQSANGVDLILTLHSGTIYEFKRDEPGQLQQTNFVDNRIVIRNVQQRFAENPLFGNRTPLEMNGCALLEAADDDHWSLRRQRAQVEYYTRLDLHRMTGMPEVLQPAVGLRPAVKPRCGVYGNFGMWFHKVMLPEALEAQEVPKGDGGRKRADLGLGTEGTGDLGRRDLGPEGPHSESRQVSSLKSHVPGQVLAVPSSQVPGPTSAAQQPVIHPPDSTVTVMPPAGFLVPVKPANQPEVLTSLMNVTGANSAARNSQRNVLAEQVEFHSRIAIALSPFCFVLLGLALALKFPSGGIGMVIGGSLIIFLGFYILLTGGTGAAKSGAIPPVIAMYTPLVTFTLLGLAAVQSANREMGSARSAGIFATIRSYFTRTR